MAAWNVGKILNVRKCKTREHDVVSSDVKYSWKEVGENKLLALTTEQKAVCLKMLLGKPADERHRKRVFNATQVSATVHVQIIH